MGQLSMDSMLIMQCTKQHFYNQIMVILSCKVSSESIRDVRSGSGKSFIVCIVLAEGTKTLRRKIQESDHYISLLASL